MGKVKHNTPMGHNGAMSMPNFAGAVDLGALAAKKKAPATGNGNVNVIDVTTDQFQSLVLEKSESIPVVLDIWAEWCGPCKQLSPILEELATEFAGKLLVAKVDADAEPQVSQALQVQSIPSVFAVIKGQLIPLFQGAYPKEQVRQIFEKLLELAAEQGLSPQQVASDTEQIVEQEEPPADPRYDAAVAAVDSGDWAAAISAYQSILDSDPADLDAQGGLIMCGIFQRIEGKTPPSGDSVDELLLAADFAAAEGEWNIALSAVVSAVQASSGQEREHARTRAVEYFALAGDDPSVPGARIALANALF